MKVNWYEGMRPPRPADLEDGGILPPEGGAIFKGTRGTLVTGVTGVDLPQLYPAARRRETKPPAPTLPRVQGSHELDWVRACKSGTRAGADFAFAGPLTEICLLGNVAKRVEARILWDTETLSITNLPGANKYIRTEYRSGWSL